jgi:perosamine synthetase
MIPVNTPFFNGNELKYITECVKTGWVSSEGKFISLFEQQFSSYIGQEYGIAVSNGSAALDIAIKALNINNGDEVIMPTFTIISPAQSVIRNGGLPVLVDSNIDTWNMDISQIEKKITKKTKAILVVHTYGLPVDMEPVLLLCKKYNLLLIEDAAEVHGQTYNGKMCGSFGDISTVSFYPNKHITTGEGGMILTDNKELAYKCRELRNLCFQKKRRFKHEHLGWNLRMSNIQAALGLAQLEQLDQFIQKKRWIGNYYNNLLFKLKKDLQLPLSSTDYSENIYWVYGVVLSEHCGFNADTIINKLNKLGVGCRPFFFPLHQQPAIKKLKIIKKSSFPVAEKISKLGFYLPSGLALTNIQIDKVVYSLNQVIKKI